MAWRIDQSVIRGELDNRTKGRVRGRIWFVDLAEPVVLELTGNPCCDLAGCLVTFENSNAPVPDRQLKEFHFIQKGWVGDITASRKVRVFDVPLEQAFVLFKQKEEPPEHLANALYLEWFSETNGRVVIESVDYRIEVSTPAWQWRPEDETERMQDAANGWKRFSEKLNATVEEKKFEKADPDEKWDEFDFEKRLRESDARTDKYLELIDKYQDHSDRERLIAEEMGWGEDSGAEEREFDIADLNQMAQEALDNPPQPDPATEGVNWIRITSHGEEYLRHPLQHRCQEGAMALRNQSDALGLANSSDEGVRQLLDEYVITAAKLAGGLNSLCYGRDGQQPGLVVASLKRALGHLHKAQAGLEMVAAKALLPSDLLTTTRQELFEIREEILRLMKEFR